MTKSLNKTIIVGRLGMDPELHQGTKTVYANFCIADTTNRSGQEETQWHRICAFGKQAELCHSYLHKGDLCCIEGRLETHSYEKDGQKRSNMSIIAEQITFLSSKRRNAPPAVHESSPCECSIDDM